MNHEALIFLSIPAVLIAVLLVIAGCGWRKIAVALLIALGGGLGGAVVLGFLGGALGSKAETGGGEWRGLTTLAFGAIGTGAGALAGLVGTTVWLVRRGKFTAHRGAPQPGLFVLAVIAAIPVGLAIFTGAQESAARIQLPSPVRCVAIDRAGTLVASGGENGAVRLWNAAGLGRRGELPGGSDGIVLALAFSPDGKVLAVSRLGRGRIELWNVADGAPRLTSTLTDAPFSDSALAFSADGQLLAAGGTDVATRLYELREGRARLLKSHFTSRSSALVVSPDSRTLVTDDGHQIVFWEITQTLPQSRRTIVAPESHFRTSPSLAFSADGAALAVSGENYPDLVRLWDLRGEAPIERTGFSDRCAQIALSADGRLLATASYEAAMYPSKEKAGPRVRLWDLSGAAPVQLASVPAHLPAQFDGATVSSVAMSADGKTLISGGRDSTVRAWNIADRNLTERATAVNEPAAKESK